MAIFFAYSQNQAFDGSSYLNPVFRLTVMYRFASVHLCEELYHVKYRESLSIRN